MLTKTTNGVTTKYVYGRGLIGEEVGNSFKTYHFDFRGSTVAITDSNGNITDTLKYDTYGKQIEHIGNSDVIFAYNGKDGVVTEPNGLIYMRARYYSPELRRFINADVVPGKISNAITLNRYAYANGNPVSFVDPFGLSVDNRGVMEDSFLNAFDEVWNSTLGFIGSFSSQIADKINAIYEQVVTFISEIDFTYSKGLAINFSVGHLVFCFQIGVSVDSAGNIALQASLADGLTTSGSGGVSVVEYRMITNAPRVSDLEGPASQFGGSVTFPAGYVPVIVGGDISAIPNPEEDSTYYYGLTIIDGVGLTLDETPMFEAEGHAAISDTDTIVKFNIFNALKEIWNAFTGGE